MMGLQFEAPAAKCGVALIKRQNQIFDFSQNKFVDLATTGLPTISQIKVADRFCENGPYNRQYFWEASIDPTDLLGCIACIHSLDSSGNIVDYLYGIPYIPSEIVNTRATWLKS